MRVNISLIKKDEISFLKQEVDPLKSWLSFHMKVAASMVFLKFRKLKLSPEQSKGKVLNIFDVFSQKI